MPSAARSDRNLLGGVLALQMDFVTGDQLLAAMHAWTLRKDTPLLDLLRRDGLLGGEDHEALERLVERHLARHGGDAARSLAAVRLDAADRRRLEQIDDSDLRSSLGGVPLPPPPARGQPRADSGAARFRRGVPHARGGLGEVFVAEDAELHRQVALKEIQERYADREDFRTRFVREAEITGQLEHPGVVPIYGLGVYADGRPYYAMRFIRGESMQDAVGRFHLADAAGRRDPGERTMALRGLLGRFVAVCNAVGYAHARRVIHRDLKPANVMLGEFGETLVVDWGLARGTVEDEDRTLPRVPIHLSREPDATQAGQAVGTPPYMPPEQARGERERVGPASDIFSLGATLYDLLTGKTPYGGANALTQAREGRFPAPRQANPAAPAALEAVCLKAMAFLPEDRYATARDLAADVERWLADEPVGAYREPLGVRAARWARRNRTLVSSAGVLLLATAAALAVGLVVVRAEQLRTADALKKAKDARDEAKENLAQAEENLGRAVEAEATAVANLKMAGHAVAECFDIAKDNPRLQEEGLKDVKKLLLEKALPFYKRFRVQRRADMRLDEQTADHFFRVAYITNEIGHQGEAVANYQASIDILRTLAASDAENKGYRNGLANAYCNLGGLLRETGKWPEAAAALRRAAEIQTELTRAAPGVPAYQESLANAKANTAALLETREDRKAALEEYKSTLDIWKKLAEVHPKSAEFQRSLAATHFHIAALLEKEDRKAAEAAYGDAIAIQRKLVAAHPRLTRFQNDLALSLNYLSILLARASEPARALEPSAEAVAIHARIAETHPDIIAFRGSLATTYNSRANILRDLNKPEEALEMYGKARDIWAGLVDRQPGLSYRAALAGVHFNRGNVFRSLNRPSDAIRAYRAACDVRQELARRQPGSADFQEALVTAQTNLGNLLDAANKRAEALELADEGLAVWARLVEKHPEVFRYKNGLARAHFNRGLLLRKSNEVEKASADFREAITVQKALVDARPADPQYKIDLAIIYNNVGDFHASLGNGEGALAECGEAIALGTELAASRPDDRMLWGMLASAHQTVGRLLLANGEHERALTSQRRARDIYSKLAAAADPFPRFQLGGSDFDIGRTLSLLSAVVRRNAQRAAVLRDQEAEKIAREAVRQLERAGRNGFFDDPRNRRAAAQDPAFAPLRDRADFKVALGDADGAK